MMARHGQLQTSRKRRLALIVGDLIGLVVLENGARLVSRWFCYEKY